MYVFFPWILWDFFWGGTKTDPTVLSSRIAVFKAKKKGMVN